MSPGIKHRIGGAWVDGGGATHAKIGGVFESLAAGPSTVNVLSLPGTSGNYVSTPDSVANSFTGEFDARLKVALNDWTPAATTTLAAKWDGQRSWTFDVNTNGTLRLQISANADGSASLISPSTVATGFVDGAVKWVRATRRLSDGRVQFLTSDDGTTWTQLGTNQTNTTSIFNSVAEVALGAMWSGGSFNMLAGKIYYFDVRNGIDGTIVQSFDATAVTKIGTRNPSSVTAGGPWTINGSAWDWAEAAA